MNVDATFFAELLAFSIFIFITYRYLWPSFSSILDSRREEISKGLEAASESQKKLEEAEDASRKMIEDAKNEASSLINQAGSRGDQIVEEAKTQATEEQLKIKSATEADIEQNVTKAKENLKQEVSSLVLAGAAKILEKEVDAESNKQIIDDLIKEL